MARVSWVVPPPHHQLMANFQTQLSHDTLRAADKIVLHHIHLLSLHGIDTSWAHFVYNSKESIPMDFLISHTWTFTVPSRFRITGNSFQPVAFYNDYNFLFFLSWHFPLINPRQKNDWQQIKMHQFFHLVTFLWWKWHISPLTGLIVINGCAEALQGDAVRRFHALLLSIIIWWISYPLWVLK